MDKLGEDIAGFFAGIGYIAQTWACMEHSLDAWIALAYHGFGGRALVDPKIPVSFSRKVRFLRSAFGQLKPLKRFDSEARPLLTKALCLSKRRNDLVHGKLVATGPVNGEWPMVIIDYDTPKDRQNWHVVREFTFSPKQLLELEAELVPLAEQVARLGLRILAIAPHE